MHVGIYVVVGALWGYTLAKLGFPPDTWQYWGGVMLGFGIIKTGEIMWASR